MVIWWSFDGNSMVIWWFISYLGMILPIGLVAWPYATPRRNSWPFNQRLGLHNTLALPWHWRGFMRPWRSSFVASSVDADPLLSMPHLGPWPKGTVTEVSSWTFLWGRCGDTCGHGQRIVVWLVCWFLHFLHFHCFLIYLSALRCWIHVCTCV